MFLHPVSAAHRNLWNLQWGNLPAFQKWELPFSPQSFTLRPRHALYLVPAGSIIWLIVPLSETWRPVSAQPVSHDFKRVPQIESSGVVSSVLLTSEKNGA